MCGISGFIDFNQGSSEAILLAMTQTLAHRGPDGQGVQFLQKEHVQVGIGHRRLAIIDLSEHGKQPMEYASLYLSYNGEIYNFQEIKDALTELGHQFQGDSDSEMILHAYKEWGAACLDLFIGMFAIFIYDSERNEVFFARDRAGVKPYFLYHHDGLLLFASELKAFHAHPHFQKELNLDAVAAFMQYGNVPTPHCIFNHCTKIKPGHFVKIDMNKGPHSLQHIVQSQYWNVYDAYNQPKLELGYDEAKKQTTQLLRSAFNYRMVADVPVGVFLSGGYDSACVTALLQSERTERLKTFTIGVPDIGLNEAPYAKEIAAHLGTDHTEINCSEKEVMDLIEDLPFFYDEPFADSSALPTTLVSKMARKEVTVALSADAGDEIFAGYNRYDYMARYGKKINAIPGFARKSLATLMQKIPSEAIPVLKHRYNFHNRYEKLKVVLDDPSRENIMLSLSQQFTPHQLDQLIRAPFQSLVTAYQSKELLSTDSTLAYMMAIDYQTYLVDDILQKVDRATMSQSLEGREPFLDQRIIEFAATLPDEYKYVQGTKKRILRDIVHDFIPQSMMDRPKMGFAIPIGTWMQHDLRYLIDEYLSETRIQQQGILNWTYVNSLKNQFLNGKKEYEMKIWYLLTFQMWYAKWMA